MPRWAQTVEERFEAKVRHNPITGCHEWTAHCIYSGYGTFRFNGKMQLSHRVAWQLYIGTIPADGGYYGTMCVCHSCDNPKCVNPAHLFLGTQAENIADMKDKGRAAKGEAHHSSKLSNELVLEIRAADGSQRHLARKYGISPSHVSAIKNGKYWEDFEI